MSSAQGLPAGTGLWAGFLDRLPSAEALDAVRHIEARGVTTIWLQEFSGVDPFVRAALYLQTTDSLTIALGVATIHARDPEAMVAAAGTLHEAFPDRFALGLGASHRALAEARGGTYARPLAAMRDYLAAMGATAGRRTLPPCFLGALGPRMVELAGAATAGTHTYFCPVAHTAAAREAMGPDAWLAPTQLVALDAEGSGWREPARRYLRFCLALPNYRRNLLRLGFTEADLDSASDAVVDALVVPDDPAAVARRIDEHRDAGADHVVVQFIPTPAASVVLDRVNATFPILSAPAWALAPTTGSHR